MDEPTARRWVERISTAFPNGRVDLATFTDDEVLPAFTDDPDDEHICALALAGGATLIVAFDKGYNVAALATRGVTVTTPDAYLVETYEEEPEELLSLVRRQASVWAGGQSPCALLDALERAGAVQFVARVRTSAP